MFDVEDSLRGAFASAQTRLQDASLAIARSGARAGGGRAADAALAHAARATVFTEALLEAERARFEQLKAVTK